MEGNARPSAGLVRALIIAAAVIAAVATHTIERWGCFDVHRLTAAEMTDTLQWLDELYSSPDGLQRPSGIIVNGKVDFASIATWGFLNYLQARADGRTPEGARAVIRRAIWDSPEWQEKHRP